MGINRGRNIIRCFTIIQMFRIPAADSSSNPPPPWLAALVSIAPCVGILTIIFYFCCHRYQKYSRKFFRFTSLANWIIFGVSMVLCLFDFEGIEINFFDGVTIPEWVIVVAILLSWLVMMVESYTCRERQYIKQIMDRNSAVRKIKELMEKEPEIKWMARGCVSSGILCLPFEKSKMYQHGDWKNKNDSVTIPTDKSAVTRIKIQLELTAADSETKLDIQRERNGWREKMEQANKYVYVDERHTIKGRRERLTVREWNGLSKTCSGRTNHCTAFQNVCAYWIVGEVQFWIASILGLTWPYRWLFKCLTAKELYTVTKTFSKPSVSTIEKTLRVAVDSLDNAESFIHRYEASHKPKHSENREYESSSEGSFNLSDISLEDINYID